MPVVPVRWTSIRDPTGKLDPKAFLCTNLQTGPLDILLWFVRLWTVEVTFEEVRRHLGALAAKPMVKSGDSPHDAVFLASFRLWP